MLIGELLMIRIRCRGQYLVSFYGIKTVTLWTRGFRSFAIISEDHSMIWEDSFQDIPREFKETRSRNAYLISLLKSNKHAPYKRPSLNPTLF